MKAPYFIETLTCNGEVLQRQQLNCLPIRLGRAYDNDFILDDAHTGLRHAVIDGHSDAQLILRDLGSQNGTIHRGKRHSTVLLSGDTVVRLGHTNLRVRGADFPMPPELTDTTMHGWEGAAPASAGLVLVALFATLTAWLDDTESFPIIRYVLAIASALGAALVWSGLWAAGNRLFGGRARLGRHLFILGCGLIAIQVWKIFSATIAYAYSLEWLTRYGNHLLVAIVCGVILFHLRTIKPHHLRPLVLASLVFLGLGSALILLLNLQRTGRLSDELYMAVILPPAVRQSRDHTVEEFMRSAGKLKAGADAARAKSIKSDAAFGDD